jgi:DNA-3-methyladenine glycosylase
MPAILSQSFYLNEIVTEIAKALLGKVLVTNINKILTSGIIIETEAYSWIERGCHAYQQRKTTRNEPMFDKGGVSYVYLCYGVYELFNVVTNKEGIADAVLIRALEPRDGLHEMVRRTKAKSPARITSGPGKLTRALAISGKHNRIDLISGEKVWIEDQGIKYRPSQINSSCRIGLNIKNDDARLPWRFTVKGNPWLSQ